MPEEFDVFLSHNSQNKLTVEAIAAHLKVRGIRAWLDKNELRPGLPWQEGLEEGVETSRSVAVFLGENGMGAWQAPEMRAFVDRSRSEKIPVIPVLLPDCPESPQLALFLRAFTWVDLRGGLTEEGLARLVWGITGKKPEGGDPEPASELAGSFSAPFLQNLPYPALGSLFQGRDEWMTRLRQSLAEHTSARATAIAGKAVHGLGGVGKTRLAVEYAWRFAGEYRAAFFVGAGSPADLRRNLAAFTGPSLLNLPELEATEEEIRVAAVLRWLRTNAGWLLILDNVDTEASARAVDRLLAQLQGGHVLMTGRLSRWSAGVEAFPLDLLAPEDAEAFLLARTMGRRRPTGDDAAKAAEIARELGYLPLALEQGGAYIAECRLTLAGYLEEWRTRREGVLMWFDARLSHYPASVAVTWQTSVDRLSESARRLLERLAWLGPEPIPESLLEVLVEGVSEEGEELRAFDLLLQLETYSLVTRSAEAPSFSVHRLVQDVTRRSLKGDRAKESLAEALVWVDAEFVGNPEDVRKWPHLEPLAPHARAVVDYADSAGIPAPTSRLMNNLGQLFDAKALFSEAEPLMRRALAIDETSFGAEHPWVAVDLNNLAQLLHNTNRLSEAEPLMRRSLAIAETSVGADRPAVAIRLNNLAQLLQALNRLSEAEPLMRRALSIDEMSFGSDHPRVSRGLNNLASLLQDTNRLSEAEPLMRRALSIDEMSFGSEHPRVAICLNNLADLLLATNRPSEAEPLMRRALSIDETSFGSDHPRVAIRLNNLAQLLKATNRLSDAEPLIRRAVEIFGRFREATGHEHPYYARVVRNLEALDAPGRKAESFWRCLFFGGR